jgi:hypothetical protein
MEDMSLYNKWYWGIGHSSFPLPEKEKNLNPNLILYIILTQRISCT